MSTSEYIDKIKAHRERHGSGLKEAKVAVDCGWTPENGGVAESYTIAQIDDAMRAISGERAVRVGEPGWHRTTQMIACAARAWINQRPDDDHARALRAGLLDLEQDGKLKPHDGVWPD